VTDDELKNIINGVNPRISILVAERWRWRTLFWRFKLVVLGQLSLVAFFIFYGALSAQTVGLELLALWLTGFAGLGLIHFAEGKLGYWTLNARFQFVFVPPSPKASTASSNRDNVIDLFRGDEAQR
jgi:hypothetical protein